MSDKRPCALYGNAGLISVKKEFLSELLFLVVFKEAVNLVTEVIAEADRIRNLVLQVFKFSEICHLSVFHLLQNNFQRLAEVIILDEVIVFIILVIDDIKIVIICIILIINVFNQFYGLRAVIARVVIVKGKDNRSRVLRVIFCKLLLQRLIGIISAFIIKFSMQRQGYGYQN